MRDVCGILLTDGQDNCSSPTRRHTNEWNRGFCESASGGAFEISLERRKETVVSILEGAREDLDVGPLDRETRFQVGFVDLER